MIQRQGQPHHDNDDHKDGDDLDDNSKSKRPRGQFKPRLARSLSSVQALLKIITSGWISLAAIVLIFLACLLSNNDEELGEQRRGIQSSLIQIGMGYLFIIKPLASTLAVVCHVENNVDLGQGRRAKTATSTMTRIIAFAFLLSIICNQLPKWLSTFVACCALLAFGLASRQLALSQQQQQQHQSSQIIQSATKSQAKTSTIKRKGHKNKNAFHRLWTNLGQKERAALGGIALVVSLLIENFIIWVVSATYQPGIDGHFDPLQDNGRTILEGLAMILLDVNEPKLARRALQRIRDVLNIQWALVSSFAAALVCLELQLGQQTEQSQTKRKHMQQKQQRTLASLAFHALVTLATARLIRTISFALTVLPSQVQNCYNHHFPYPPPSQWGEWLMVGFLPNTRGGCNDLILSGHATVTSTLGCAFTSAAGSGKFAVAVWTLIALDYSIEAYQGLHYSVDMWLGCVVTCLLWQLTKPLEFADDGDEVDVEEDCDNNSNENEEESNNEIAKSKDDGPTQQSKPPPPPPLDANIVGMYAIPVALAFLVMTVVPEAYINYFLVGFSTWAGVYFSRYGITNYLQHVLLCELCFGLGCYL